MSRTPAPKRGVHFKRNLKLNVKKEKSKKKTGIEIVKFVVKSTLKKKEKKRKMKIGKNEIVTNNEFSTDFTEGPLPAN